MEIEVPGIGSETVPPPSTSPGKSSDPLQDLLNQQNEADKACEELQKQFQTK